MATQEQPKNALTGQQPAPASATGYGSLRVFVGDGKKPAARARVVVYKASDTTAVFRDNAGVLKGGFADFDDLPVDEYLIRSFYPRIDKEQRVKVAAGCRAEVCLDLGLSARMLTSVIDPDCAPRRCAQAVVGDMVELKVVFGAGPDGDGSADKEDTWRGQWLKWPSDVTVTGNNTAKFYANQPGLMQGSGDYLIAASAADTEPALFALDYAVPIAPRPAVPVAGNLTVSHRRRIPEPTGPMAFFVHLLDASNSVGFNAYHAFIDQVLCRRNPQGLDACEAGLAGTRSKLERLQGELTDHGVGAYDLLRTATEAFLLLRCCVRPCANGDQQNGTGWPGGAYGNNPQLGDYQQISSNQWQGLYCDYRQTLVQYLGNNRLPYIDRVVQTAFPEYREPGEGRDARFCDEVLLRSRVDNPCFMELIWNYWHEEGMLVQSINAVSRRFQNLRAPGVRDPLAHMEIDPLRPLNNILWGYAESERDRLSVKRRAYEYQHQYGLSLYGKAVADLRPADTRSKFIEAFHNLLNKCADYFRAKQDTTVDPDGYPILHAIQELNLILAQGAHNQFGDLAWNARVDMLMQEWIMARPELRDFLQSRAMVPYKESWMPPVDTMKTLQGWTDVVVTHFRDLGVFGEQILLTIRWYNWYDVTSEEEAKDWADLLRAQIQGYIHAYRAVTGVDLANMDAVDYTMPSLHLRKRLAMQQRAR